LGTERQRRITLETTNGGGAFRVGDKILGTSFNQKRRKIGQTRGEGWEG